MLPYRSDSAHVAGDRSLPDTTVRFVPGGPRAPICQRRVDEDRSGFTLYPPFLLDHGGGNVYLRDLHARDSLVLGQYPGRPVWLLTKAPPVGSPLRFERVPVDSMLREWKED